MLDFVHKHVGVKVKNIPYFVIHSATHKVIKTNILKNQL